MYTHTHGGQGYRQREKGEGGRKTGREREKKLFQGRIPKNEKARI